MRLVILEAESLGKDMDLSGFSRFGEVTVYEKTTEEECPERVREADIVICNKVRMCSRTLSGAENLKLICVTATGINNIDLDYVKRHNIAVTNVAGYSTVSVAQHTFAMYFYLAEKLRYYDDYVKNGSYAASRLAGDVWTRFFRAYRRLPAVFSPAWTDRSPSWRARRGASSALARSAEKWLRLHRHSAAV